MAGRSNITGNDSLFFIIQEFKASSPIFLFRRFYLCFVWIKLKMLDKNQKKINPIRRKIEGVVSFGNILGTISTG